MFSSVSMKDIYLPLFCSIIIVSKVHIYVCTNINEYANKTSYHIEENVGGKKTLVNCWQIIKIFSLKFMRFLIFICHHSPNFSPPKSLNGWIHQCFILPLFTTTLYLFANYVTCITKQNLLDAKVKH